MSGAYYNENDPFAAAWLRELIKSDLIAPGEVDERSIEEVKPEDVRGFTQCHFFAGIGVWSYALRNAGWSDDTPVWTGSCPCQGFSASGQRGGFSDKRHLWPSWFRLIRESRPIVCFGEQVASKDGLAWLDVVSADMETEGYAVGAVDTCAAGLGAPHIRQRLYFVGESHSARSQQGEQASASVGYRHTVKPTSRVSQLVNTEINGRIGRPNNSNRGRRECPPRSPSTPSGMVNPERGRQYGRQDFPESLGSGNGNLAESAGEKLTNGFWGNAEWIYCSDEKYRPVEPGTFPLASGTANRVGRLRGYGNAINAEVARGFIEAYMSL